MSEHEFSPGSTTSRSAWTPRCSTITAAPSSSISTATCSVGPKATTPARSGTRSSCTRARSASSCISSPAIRISRAPAMDHFGVQSRVARAAAGDRRQGEGPPGGRRTRHPDRRARAHDAGPDRRLHAHQRVHRFRDAVARGAPAPRTSRALAHRRPRTLPLRGAHRHSRRPGWRLGDGVVAAARDGRHGRPHDHNRVSAQQAAAHRA